MSALVRGLNRALTEIQSLEFTVHGLAEGSKPLDETQLAQQDHATMTHRLERAVMQLRAARDSIDQALLAL